MTEMKKERVIIVGANHAGTAATRQLLALNPELEVVVMDKNTNISFLGCGMALWIGGQISSGDGLFYASKEALEEAGAKVHLETEVTEVDYDKQEVHYRDAEGEHTMSYDKLILATGSRPVHPPIPGLDLPYIQHAKLYQDAAHAVEQIKHDDSIQKVIVVGAGYIGAELAEAYRRVGKDVTLIDMMDQILGTHYDEDFAKTMENHLRSHGIKMQLGEKIVRFEGDDRVRSVVTDKGSYEADLVMFCIGFRPNSELGGETLERFKNGAILVDRKQETSVPGVYAIGDCATIYDNSIRETNYIALATNAVRTGLIAAFNIAGRSIEGLGVQGSSGLCLYGLRMVSTGQTVRSAAAHGIEALSTEFTAQQKPPFMDEVGPNPEVKIRITYRKDDHVVIGAQLMSEYDMSASIHLFSLAIQEQVTIERIALLDLFFMPHFNEPYNYITMAALGAL